MLPEFAPLTEKEQAIIEQHLLSDPVSLALRLHGKNGIDGKKIIQQITARQKARYKLPDWYSNPHLFFPPSVSVEQASSQATALYKASLTGGHHLADLTLGMGVDSFYFSGRFQKISGYEINPDLAAITAYNLAASGVSNIEVLNGSAENAALPADTDCIFIDPSRRDSQKKKTVAFEDSSPDVLRMLPGLTSSAREIIIKSSPLIDIDQAVSQLKHVSEVHVVGYQKECKEVVFLLRPEAAGRDPSIHAVWIDDKGGIVYRLVFTRQQESGAKPYYSDPSGYLYEPHPSFMKAGAFNLLSQEYGVRKIAPNSHLYSSDELRTDFPGRLFEIAGVVNASGFSWQNVLTAGKANLTLRNFPATPDDLRKKWRLKEGGHDYLFATTLSSGRKVVIVTRKATV